MARPADRLRYLKVGAALFVVVLAVYGGAWWLAHRVADRQGGDAGLPSRPSATVSASAVAGIPTANTSRSRPTSWTVIEMTDPNTGRRYFMAPPEVVATVRQDYQDMDQYFREHVFDAKAADLDRYFAEPELSAVKETLTERSQRGEARGRADLLRPDLQILGFSQDGRTVQVGQESHAETIPIYDLATRQVIRVEHTPVGVGVSTMVYDPESARWKLSDTRFLDAPAGTK